MRKMLDAVPDVDAWDLALLSTGDTYATGGPIDIDAQQAHYSGAVVGALANGYAGYRCVADITHRGYAGYFHETAFYESDEELLSIVVRAATS